MKLFKKSVFFLVILVSIILVIADFGFLTINCEKIGNLALVEMKVSNTGQDFSVISHGVFISPEYVLATRHYVDLAGQILVNGFPAEIKRVWDQLDLLLIKTKANNSFCGIKFGITSCGKPVFTLALAKKDENENAQLIKAGTVKEMLFDKITLIGFVADCGESGKPVFSEEGELIGIIQSFNRELNETYLIPSYAIKKEINLF